MRSKNILITALIACAAAAPLWPRSRPVKNYNTLGKDLETIQRSIKKYYAEKGDHTANVEFIDYALFDIPIPSEYPYDKKTQHGLYVKYFITTKKNPIPHIEETLFDYAKGSGKIYFKEHAGKDFIEQLNKWRAKTTKDRNS